MIKMMKEKEKVHNQVDDLATILDTLRKGLDAKAKTIKIKNVKKKMDKSTDSWTQEQPTTYVR